MTYLDAFKYAEQILMRLEDGMLVMESEVKRLEAAVDCYRGERYAGLHDRFEQILAKMGM